MDTSRSANASGGSVVSACRTRGSWSPSVGINPWMAARTGATTTMGPVPSRRRWADRALAPATGGAGLIPSYGRDSHAGKRTTRSGPRNVAAPAASTSAACGSCAIARTGASIAVARAAATKAWPGVAAWAARTGPGAARSRSNGPEPIASSRTSFSSSRPTPASVPRQHEEARFIEPGLFAGYSDAPAERFQIILGLGGWRSSADRWRDGNKRLGELREVGPSPGWRGRPHGLSPLIGAVVCALHPPVLVRTGERAARRVRDLHQIASMVGVDRHRLARCNAL